MLPVGAPFPEAVPAEEGANGSPHRCTLAPWVREPYRLWSLLDMLRFNAVPLIETMQELERAVHAIQWSDGSEEEEGAAREKAERATKRLLERAGELPIPDSLLLQVGFLYAQSQEGKYQGALDALIENLSLALSAALEESLFLAIPGSHRPYYEGRQFWTAGSLDAFPDSERDLLAASRCFAVDEWTASVFHAMRGVELALRKWAGELGVVLKVPVDIANQQDILNAADKAIRDIEQLPKPTPGRSERLEYFSETQIDFRAFKIAWRNHVSHGNRWYDGREAEEILGHVRSFMARPSLPTSRETGERVRNRVEGGERQRR